MLSKKFRLPIQSVLNKSGRIFRSRSFLIKVFSNQSEFNRFGVVISKKVDKRAVKRNLIKRIILDFAKKFVRPSFAGLRTGKQPADAENKNKADVLIIISPAMIKLGKADIIKELEEALKKIV